MKGLIFSLYPLLILAFSYAPNSVYSANSKKNFREILQSHYVEEIFELLGPRNLLFKSYDNDVIGYDDINKDDDRDGHDDCVRDLKIFKKALEKKIPWAVTMMDASSRIPSGITEGNIIDVGLFDQCVEVEGKYFGKEIHGRHCMYSINLIDEDNVMPIKPTMSICLPTNCKPHHVIGLIEGAINKTERMKSLGISAANAECTENNLKFLDMEFIIWFSVMFSYGAILVFCTLLHMLRDRLDPKSSWQGTVQILSQFSLIKSSLSVLSLEAPEGVLGVINGMRFFSTAFIVLFHSYFMQFFAVNVNFITITEWVVSWRTIPLIIMGFSVDTFFILSGFLMTYTFSKKIQRTKEFNVLMHYVHRIIRLTPPVIVLVYSSIAMVPRLASGPRWEWLMKIFLTGLRENWMYSLLYIQNFVNKYDYRILHFWSLSVDMQLFWISPIILTALYKRPKIGLLLLASLIVICQVVTASIIGINSYPLVYLTREWNMTLLQESFNESYQVPYTRASSWLSGILLGFVITKNLRPNKWINITGWSAATVGSLIFILCVRCVTMYPEHNLIRDVIFMLFARMIWSIIICWIIYSSITDNTGTLNKILSWKYFLPLSKISYSIYLLHIIFPTLRIGASRTPAYFNDYQIIHCFMGDLLLSIVSAFLYSILFEVPVLTLEKMIFPSRRGIIQGSKKIE